MNQDLEIKNISSNTAYLILVSTFKIVNVIMGYIRIKRKMFNYILIYYKYPYYIFDNIKHQ